MLIWLKARDKPAFISIFKVMLVLVVGKPAIRHNCLIATSVTIKLRIINILPYIC